MTTVATLPQSKPHRRRRRRSAKQYVCHWLRVNGHPNAELDPKPIKVGRVWVKPQIYLPSLKVYLLVTGFREDSSNAEHRGLIKQYDWFVRQAKRHGYACIRVDGRMREGLEKSDPAARRRLWEALETQGFPALRFARDQSLPVDQRPRLPLTRRSRPAAA